MMGTQTIKMALDRDTSPDVTLEMIARINDKRPDKYETLTGPDGIEALVLRAWLENGHLVLEVED